MSSTFTKKENNERGSIWDCSDLYAAQKHQKAPEALWTVDDRDFVYVKITLLLLMLMLLSIMLLFMAVPSVVQIISLCFYFL